MSVFFRATHDERREFGRDGRHRCSVRRSAQTPAPPGAPAIRPWFVTRFAIGRARLRPQMAHARGVAREARIVVQFRCADRVRARAAVCVGLAAPRFAALPCGRPDRFCRADTPSPSARVSGRIIGAIGPPLRCARSLLRLIDTRCAPHARPCRSRRQRRTQCAQPRQRIRSTHLSQAGVVNQEAEVVADAPHRQPSLLAASARCPPVGWFHASLGIPRSYRSRR